MVPIPTLTSINNDWDYLTFKSPVSHIVGTKTYDDITTNAILMYVNASLNEQSENDTTVYLSIIYYMGVSIFESHAVVILL